MNLTSQKSTHTSFADLLLISLLGCSLLGNVFLGWQIRALKSAVGQRIEPKVGIAFPELAVSTLNGEDKSLVFDRDRSTVIYIFRPGCKWCALNYSNAVLLSNAVSPRVRFVGLSTTDSGLKEYLAQYPLPFPVFSLHNPSDLSAVGFAGTPQTVVVSAGGKIEQNWPGVYAGSLARSIQRRFNVKLDMLQPENR